MSWDDPEERRKEFRRWFGDFLPDSLFREIEEMMERMMSQMGEDGFFDPEAIREFMENPQNTSPFLFGFRVQIGSDGKPTIQRFGNPGPESIGEDVPPVVEPLVDVFDEEDEVIVVADLPGVGRNEIGVKIKGEKLTIHVENPDRPYHKEIRLPAKVVKDEATSSLRNGVLEIRLRKAV
ncbi:MAG: Hsp20/alpha crystallin family protein [Candidatus Thorarchaeota archaeon]|nr:MAG: Hsp20/alpha crystallin family protein [Candidatus Thorarchaeota archaeon]